jgi:cytochrome c peroxidase
MGQRSYFILAGLLMLTACQPARRYEDQSVNKQPEAKVSDKSDADLRRLSWTEQRERYDLPIRFVADKNPEWEKLTAFWNPPPFPAGMPTAHIGLLPLGAAMTLVVTEQQAAIKIKVPRGLPDPTPHIPAANPPTLGKWRLGQALFFKPILKAGNDKYSCHVCHDPRYGFSEDLHRPPGGKYNTLALVNSVYNRRQFWDGRAETLEETLTRSFEDERKLDAAVGREKALEQHIWTDVARNLGADKDLVAEFKLVFGVDQPTQNTAAQALATYMRTLLSGDSIHDRADAVRRAKNANQLTAEHFASVVKDEASAASLRDDTDRQKPGVEKLPDLLQKGHDLFHGKAGCVKCHQGPLFTDHDYHNIGYEGKEAAPEVGVETGRSVHVPVGLKEWRLVGAFRTPSLRNLRRTAPYFHDGSHATLRMVVEFYDGGVLPTLHLAAPLRDPAFPSRLDEKDAIALPRRLHLNYVEKDALVLYLRSLQGEPLDGVLLPKVK